jgi:hypothetical protein
MIRKTMLALAATAALGAAALAPTAASAKYFGGGGFHGFHGFHGYGVTVVSPAVSCWQSRWVETRRGLRRIVVNVCDY